MKKNSASCLKLREMRINNCHSITTGLLLYFLTTAFVSQGQPAANKKDPGAGLLSVAYFVESANNSVNSLNSLLKKDNYRNKITTLNNPTNNELGFSLKTEILTALKPILDKAKKTDGKKFKEVIENFLSNPEENGISSVKKYLPALGIFSTVLSLVGNLVIVEKTITKEDLNVFIAKIQQYFSQYEKLNTINQQFGMQVQKLLDKSEEIKGDLKDFLVDCICTMNRGITKASITDMSVEALVQKYYDPQKMQNWLDTSRAKNEGSLYPPDAPTSVKLLTSGIKKLQKEFEMLYSDNYKQLKELIASLKTTIPNLDQKQLDKTNSDIDKLYNDSRQADIINLNINQVDERMNTACRIINTGK
jgi:hypothetical protein